MAGLLLETKGPGQVRGHPALAGLSLPFHVWPLRCDWKVIPSQHVTRPCASFSGEPTPGQHIFGELTAGHDLSLSPRSEITANTSLGLSSWGGNASQPQGGGGRAGTGTGCKQHCLLFPGQGVGPQGDLGSKS